MLIQDKKLKNGTPDSRGASTSSESIVVSADNRTNVPQTRVRCWIFDLLTSIFPFLLIQGTPTDKKAENETPDSKEVRASSDSTGASIEHNMHFSMFFFVILINTFSKKKKMDSGHVFKQWGKKRDGGWQRHKRPFRECWGHIFGEEGNKWIPRL